MTITMTDRAAHRPVTALPACELERRVLDAGLRPCAAPGANPEDWFPDPGSDRGAAALYESRALVLCRGCPVAIECLELAMLREGPARGHGISGGTTPWQRQQIKASRAVCRG
jgi:hypothetical protein